MSGWWWAAAVLAVAGPLVAWLTVSPWSRCRPCHGCGTLRDSTSGKWAAHCRRCKGYGRVERGGREVIRSLTGGVLFRHPPEHPYPGMQLYGRANPPFAGGGRRPRRKRAPSPRRSHGQWGR